MNSFSKFLPAIFFILASGNLYGQATVPPTLHTTPLPRIKEDDIAWKKRLWGDVDVVKDANKLFGSKDRPQHGILINILIGGVMSGQITAYSAVDDRFTTVLKQDELQTLLMSRQMSSGNANKDVAPFNSGMVTKYKIKEDWIGLKDGSIPFYRVLGIAPVVNIVGEDGTISERPLFWIYYPNCRDYLAQYKIFGVNDPAMQTWEKLFDTHQFDSYTKKVAYAGTIIEVN